MKNFLLASFVLSLILSSCEEQMIPIPERPAFTEGRVMLIEDVTGVKCVPCYNANIYITNLLKESNGAVVTYGIHMGAQSDPHSTSKYDFRTPDVMELEATVDGFGQPRAMFNRVLQSNGRKAQINSATWQPYVDAELTKPNFLKLDMTSEYNPNSRTMQLEVEVTPLVDVSGETNLHVVITENHLIDPQSSPDGVIEDYEHNHVMKESLTGVTGQFLSDGLIAFENQNLSFTYSLPAEDNGEWIAENIEVVAFVTSKAQNDEVLQAGQIHMVE